MQFIMIVSSIFGTAALVFYTFPYLGIIFAPMIIFYYFAAIYYRRSSVEIKRLDSLLRSFVYASYSGKPCIVMSVRCYQASSPMAQNPSLV